jgi:hypothetical protein
MDPIDRLGRCLQRIGPPLVSFHRQLCDDAGPPPNLHLDLSGVADAIQLRALDGVPQQLL